MKNFFKKISVSKVTTVLGAVSAFTGIAAGLAEGISPEHSAMITGAGVIAATLGESISKTKLQVEATRAAMRKAEAIKDAERRAIVSSVLR